MSSRLSVSKFECSPIGLAPMRIAQVSDLHNAGFGSGQEKLLSPIVGFAPDLIAVTGDLFSRKDESATDNSFAFIAGALKIAPLFMCEGNHELVMHRRFELESALKRLGVRILIDEGVSYKGLYIYGLSANPDKTALDRIPNRPMLLLAHRPELFTEYAKRASGLTLSGHAHGGQARIFGQGLFAPEQGIFPRYSKGGYKANNMCMYVSAGLGNTVPVPRVFDPPELVLIEIKRKD